MEYRSLGKSGIQISALSFGSWVTFGNQLDTKKATELMVYAYEQGVNFFDNAEVYAHGESERMMGHVLKQLNWDRSSYLISSKAFFGRGDKRPNMTGLSRKHLFEACNEALHRFQTDYLDLFFAHRPDKRTPIEETVWAMHQLILQGKILYWGTSEWSAQEIMEAHMCARQNHLIGPIMEQPEYNMLTRSKVEVEYKHMYETVGLGTTIWSPLASGILTTKYHSGSTPDQSRMSLEGYQWLKEKRLIPEHILLSKKLNALALEIGSTLPKMAIGWCLLNKNVSSVILGATRLSQLEENLKAAEDLHLLTAEIQDQIESILNNKPIQPLY